MSTNFAVDASYDRLTQEEARCLQEGETGLFVQCLLAMPVSGPERPAPALANLDMARPRMLIAGYVAIGHAAAGRWYVDTALDGMRPDIKRALNFVAIDVELPGIQASTIRAAITRVKEHGLRPIIYTSYNAWTNYVRFDQPDNFNDVLLWNAYWDGAPDVDFPSLRYGLWQDSQVIGEQWSGGIHVCGQFVDRNTFVQELLTPAPPEEEDDMNETITNFDGTPQMFKVVQGDLTIKRQPLTYRQFIFLGAKGLVVDQEANRVYAAIGALER